MADYALSDLTESTALVVSDLLHLRTVGSIDKKIEVGNAFGLLKGFLSVVITEYDTTDEPAIGINSLVEINGSIYKNTSEVAISGSISNGQWKDILLTPSGTTFTASYETRSSGVWSDTKQGLYTGNNRVVACVYKNGAAEFVSKNILVVVNRIVRILIAIGNWDMDDSANANVEHGLGSGPNMYIKSIDIIIANDSGDGFYKLSGTALGTGAVYGGIEVINSSTIHISRLTGGLFDSTDFDTFPFNRGDIVIEYVV